MTLVTGDLAKALAQLPQLLGYFRGKLLILLTPKKKVVTTNYVLRTSLVDSISDVAIGSPGGAMGFRHTAA
jgi:hypothetical protein